MGLALYRMIKWFLRNYPFVRTVRYHTAEPPSQYNPLRRPGEVLIEAMHFKDCLQYGLFVYR